MNEDNLARQGRETDEPEKKRVFIRMSERKRDGERWRIECKKNDSQGKIIIKI
jgi:hypothetical protein